VVGPAALPFWAEAHYQKTAILGNFQPSVVLQVDSL